MANTLGMKLLLLTSLWRYPAYFVIGFAMGFWRGEWCRKHGYTPRQRGKFLVTDSLVLLVVIAAITLAVNAAISFLERLRQ